MHQSEVSKLISHSDNERLMAGFDRGSLSLCSTICQILEGRNGKWQVIGSGFLCFIKHKTRKTFLLQCYDFETGKRNFEMEMYTELDIEMRTSKLLTFNGLLNCRIGLNFYEKMECEKMLAIITSKICRRDHVKTSMNQDRTRRLKTIRGGRIEQVQSHAAPAATGKGKRMTKSRGLKKTDISGPVLGSFQHTDGYENRGKTANEAIDEVLLNPEIQQLFKRMGLDPNSAEAKEMVKTYGSQKIKNKARTMTIKYAKQGNKLPMTGMPPRTGNVPPPVPTTKPKKRPGRPAPGRPGALPAVSESRIQQAPMMPSAPPPPPGVQAPRPPAPPNAARKPNLPSPQAGRADLMSALQGKVALKAVDEADKHDASKPALVNKTSVSTMEDDLKKKLADMHQFIKDSDSEEDSDTDSDWE